MIALSSTYGPRGLTTGYAAYVVCMTFKNPFKKGSEGLRKRDVKDLVAGSIVVAWYVLAVAVVVVVVVVVLVLVVVVVLVLLWSSC